MEDPTVTQRAFDALFEATPARGREGVKQNKTLGTFDLYRKSGADCKFVQVVQPEAPSDAQPPRRLSPEPEPEAAPSRPRVDQEADWITLFECHSTERTYP